MNNGTKYEERVPSLSRKEAMILDMLLLNASRGMYGLELVNKSDGRLKRGTVYVTLSRMQEKGFIESHQEEQEEGSIGLPRRLYKPTGFGQKIFEAWQLVKQARNLAAYASGSMT